MSDFKKCSHPNIEVNSGIQVEGDIWEDGDPDKRRTYLSEYCPDCKYENFTFGEWTT